MSITVIKKRHGYIIRFFLIECVLSDYERFPKGRGEGWLSTRNFTGANDHGFPSACLSPITLKIN